jgi:hypothetical protein
LVRLVSALTGSLILLTVIASGHQLTLASRTLLATVSTANRQLVDLGPDDFLIEEDGVGREVFDVHLADYPLGVLIDNASADELEAIRAAAARFVARVGQRGIAIGKVTSATLLTTFDDERLKVLDEIKNISAEPQSPPMPLELLSSTLGVVQESGAPFSAIIVVSGQALDPDTVGSPGLLTQIFDSKIPVHVIARRASSSAEPLPDVWREVSRLTRGQYTTIYSGASYPIALDRLADRLATEMMIQFVVPKAGAPVGEMRVGVKVPGAMVTTLGVSR